MITGRIALVLFLIAQPAATDSLRSYRDAMAVLQAGVDAMGGVDALRGVRTVRRELTNEWYGSGQSKMPFDRMPPSNEHRSGFVFTDDRGNRWLEELHASDSSDVFMRISVGTPEKAFTNIVYHEETPFHASDDDVAALRIRRFRHYPESLLLTVLDRPESLRLLGPGIISFADALGTQVTLHFDSRTHLLAKVETLREHATAGDTTSEIVFSDYRPVGKLKLPFHFADRVAGVTTEATTINAIHLDVAMADERFRPPAKVVTMVDDPAEPRVEQLGKNLYLIRGPYNVLFAAFRDHVVVFEAPRNSDYGAACMELIGRTLPGLPIRFVVATHFHYDHIAGLRPYIAAGIPIITTIDAKRSIEQVAASKRTMHPDALSAAPRAATIETVSGSRVLDDGSNRIELYDIGPTDHVAHILAVYVPAEKLLFEADLFDPVTTELVIASLDGAILSKRIRELGLDVERIIPVHGIPTTLADLERGVAVRAKYH